jgi:thiol-disulfide isomerase/thioredoxin
MERFEREGKKYWESFGRNIELLPRQYFDFVNHQQYQEVLKEYELRNKIVVDFGAGYPGSKEYQEKKLAPLASELQEVLEGHGAKIIAIDVAEAPLKAQKESGREPVFGSAFELPFKDESIDGGAVVLNFFNSSFKGKDGREIFITPEECKKILQETYRILQEDKFVIVNNYGYLSAEMDDVAIMGPQNHEVIAPEKIEEMAREAGFRNVKKIPLDEVRIELAEKFIAESFPEALRDRIKVAIKGSGALLLRK